MKTKSEVITDYDLIVLFLFAAVSINCYQCNSFESPECKELVDLETSVVKGFLKMCEDRENGNRKPFCRTSKYTSEQERTCGNEINVPNNRAIPF